MVFVGRTAKHPSGNMRFELPGCVRTRLLASGPGVINKGVWIDVTEREMVPGNKVSGRYRLYRLDGFYFLRLMVYELKPLLSVLRFLASTE